MLDRGKFKAQRSYNQGKPQQLGSKPELHPQTASSSLWKERHERDFRKAHGLCFYCAEKFEPGHADKCAKRPKAQLNALAINDLDVQLTDEILHQLAVEDSMAEQFIHLSLNALSVAENSNCIKLRALVHNKVMLILIDSGSSHSFVSSSFVQQLGLSSVPISPSSVKLPNGEVLMSDRMIPQFTWWCQGHTIYSDMRVLDLDVYDAILGYDWLQAHSPMTCDWL